MQQEKINKNPAVNTLIWMSFKRLMLGRKRKLLGYLRHPYSQNKLYNV
jgi:hypothetical protein